jgi:hypothetical protein
MKTAEKRIKLPKPPKMNTAVQQRVLGDVEEFDKEDFIPGNMGEALPASSDDLGESRPDASKDIQEDPKPKEVESKKRKYRVQLPISVRKADEVERVIVAHFETDEHSVDLQLLNGEYKVVVDGVIHPFYNVTDALEKYYKEIQRIMDETKDDVGMSEDLTAFRDKVVDQNAVIMPLLDSLGRQHDVEALKAINKDLDTFLKSRIYVKPNEKTPQGVQVVEENEPIEKTKVYLHQR